jgi:hypothetical protein
MTAVIVSPQAKPPIVASRYARNGKAPSAEFQAKLAEALGFAARVRTRFVFGRATPISALPNSAAGTRVRWEFAWDSGPYVKTLLVWMELAPQNNGAATAPYALLEVKPLNADGTEGSVVGQGRVSWGAGTGTGTTNDIPSKFGGGVLQLVSPSDGVTPVTLTAGAAYCGTISDVDYARVLSVAVWEASLPPDTDNGYPKTGVAVNTPIYDKDRADVAVMARNLWHGNGGLHWNWTAETQATAPSQGLDGLSGSLSQSIGSITLSAAGTVATSTPTFQAAGTYQAGVETTSISVSWPTHQADDVALLHVMSDTYPDFYIGSPANRHFTADGWTSIESSGFSYTVGEETHYISQGIFWKRASGASEAAADVEADGPCGYIAGQITAYRGVVTSGTPYDIEASGFGGSGTAVTMPTGTTTVANTLLVASVISKDCGPHSGWTHGSLSVTERVDQGYMGIATAPNAPSGAFTAISATLTDSATATLLEVIALKP